MKAPPHEGKRLIYTGTTDPWGPNGICKCNSPGRPELPGNGRDDDVDGLVDEGGGNNNSCSAMQAGKPVHLQSGNMTLQHDDFVLQTGGRAIAFSRVYNHQWEQWRELYHSRLGAGWRHSYQSRVVKDHTYDSNENVTATFYSVVFADTSISFKELNNQYYSQHKPNFQLTQLTTSNDCKGMASSCWLMTTPQGTKYYYATSSDGRLLREESNNGSFLKFSYTSSGTSPTKYYLQSIEPFLVQQSGQTTTDIPLEKIILFHYASQICGGLSATQSWDVLSKVVLRVNSSTATTCTSDNDCSSSGGTCAIPKNATQGLCGKAILTLEYGDAGFDTCTLTKAHRNPADTTADYIQYNYNGAGWMSSAVDANGKTLEAHDYDMNTSSSNHGKATSSTSGSENIAISYTSSTQSVVTSPGVTGYSRTVNYDATTSRMINQTQSCSCSSPTTSQTWTPLGGSNPAPNHNVLLPLS